MISSDTESLAIVCAADNNYVIPLSVTLKSILVNLKISQRITCFVIDGGIQEVNKQKILKSLDSQQIIIEWLQPTDAILSKVKVSGHVTVATYYRLLIPDLLPQHIEKVIYLDCDLVVNEDLQKLWAISTQAIEYLEQNKEHVLNWDQDGVNAVLAGKWRELDPRWNQTPSVYKYRSWKDSPFTEDDGVTVIQQPYIIHFATAIKPWHYYCEHPAKDLFFQYLDMTSWSGWRPKKPLKYIIRLGLRRFRENIKSLLKSFAWHLSLSR